MVFYRTCTEDNTADGDNRVEMLMWLTDPCRYDRWTRPLPSDSNGKTGGPTRVFARVYVYFLGSVEAQQLVSTHLTLKFAFIIYFNFHFSEMNILSQLTTLHGLSTSLIAFIDQKPVKCINYIFIFILLGNLKS